MPGIENCQRLKTLKIFVTIGEILKVDDAPETRQGHGMTSFGKPAQPFQALIERGGTETLRQSRRT